MVLYLKDHFSLRSAFRYFLRCIICLKILMKKLWIMALNWTEYAGSPTALKTIDHNSEHVQPHCALKTLAFGEKLG